MTPRCDAAAAVRPTVAPHFVYNCASRMWLGKVECFRTLWGSDLISSPKFAQGRKRQLLYILAGTVAAAIRCTCAGMRFVWLTQCDLQVVAELSKALLTLSASYDLALGEGGARYPGVYCLMAHPGADVRSLVSQRLRCRLCASTFHCRVLAHFVVAC